MGAIIIEFPVFSLVLALSMSVLVTVLIWRVSSRSKKWDYGRGFGSIVLKLFCGLWYVQGVRNDLRRIYNEKRH